MPRLAIQNLTNSLAFNGSNTIVVIPKNSSVTAISDFTIATFAKITRYNGNMKLCSIGYNYSTNQGFMVYINGSGLFSVYQGNTSKHTIAVPLNTWVHLVVTQAGNTVNYYINGLNIGTSTGEPELTQNVAGGSYQIGIDTGKLTGTLSQWQLFNRALNSTEINQLVNGEAVNNGLVIAYDFNQSSGSIATDSSGNGNNGSITAGAWSTDIPSMIRPTPTNPRTTVQDYKCSYLRSAGAAINVPTGNGFPLYNTSAFSVSGWFHGQNNTSGRKTIYGEGNTGDFNSSYLLHISGQNLELFLQTAAGGATSNLAGKYDFSVWHHFVLTDKRGTVHLYIDGVEDPISSLGDLNYTPPSITVNTSAIGAQIRSGGSWANTFAGSLTDFRFYNRVLSAAEATQSFQGRPSSSGLIAQYSMQEGSQTTIYDTSGNGNNATMTGSWTSDVPSRKRVMVGNNMVYNGDFEFAPLTNVAQTTNGNWIDGTSGGSSSNSVFSWGFFSKSGTGSIMFDNSTSNSGKYSLKVSTQATNSSIIAGSLTNTTAASLNSYGIKALPNTSYTFTYWMKTQLNSGSSVTGACIRLTEYDANGGSAIANVAANVLTTTSWTQYTKVFTTASTTRFIVPRLAVVGNDGTSTLIMDAWFDDIVLIPTVNTTRNVST